MPTNLREPLKERLNLDKFVQTQVRDKPSVLPNMLSTPLSFAQEQIHLLSSTRLDARLSILRDDLSMESGSGSIILRNSELHETPLVTLNGISIIYPQLPTPPLTPPSKPNVGEYITSPDALIPTPVREKKATSSKIVKNSSQQTKPHPEGGKKLLNEYRVPIPPQIFNEDKVMPYVGKHVRKNAHPLGGWLHLDDKPVVIDKANPFANYLRSGEKLIFIEGELNVNKEVFEEHAYYVTCSEQIQQPFNCWSWDDRPIEHDKADIDAYLKELHMTLEDINPDPDHSDANYIYKIKYLDGRNKVVEVLAERYLQAQGYSSFAELYEDWIVSATDCRPKHRGHIKKRKLKNGRRPYLSYTREEQELNNGCCDYNEENQKLDSNSSEFIEKLKNIEELKALPSGHNPVLAWLDGVEGEYDRLEGHLYQTDAKGREAVKTLRDYQDGFQQRFEYTDAKFCYEIEDWMRPQFLKKHSKTAQTRSAAVVETTIIPKPTTPQPVPGLDIDSQIIASKIPEVSNILWNDCEAPSYRPECSDNTIWLIMKRFHQLRVDPEGYQKQLKEDPDEAGSPSVHDCGWERAELEDALFALDRLYPRSDGLSWTVEMLLEIGVPLSSIQPNQWGHCPFITEIKLRYMESCEEPDEFIRRFREAQCVGMSFGNPDTDPRLEKAVRVALFYARRMTRKPQLFLEEYNEVFYWTPKASIDEDASLFPDWSPVQEPTTADWALRIGEWRLDITDVDFLPHDLFSDCACGREAFKDLQAYQDSCEYGKKPIPVPDWARAQSSLNSLRPIHSHSALLEGPLYCQFQVCEHHLLETERVWVLYGSVVNSGDHNVDPVLRLQEVVAIRARDRMSLEQPLDCARVCQIQHPPGIDVSPHERRKNLNALHSRADSDPADRRNSSASHYLSPLQSLLAICPPPKIETPPSLHELLVEHRYHNNELHEDDVKRSSFGARPGCSLEEQQAAELKALLGVGIGRVSTKEMQQTANNLCDSGYGSWSRSDAEYY